MGWILLDHLYMYGARLTLHKKLNGKSRSSPDSPPTVPCLDFYFRHRSHTSASSEVTLYAWPPMGCVAAAVVSIGLLLRQKVGNCKDKGYLKMTPSPSNFGIIGIPDHLAGLLTQQVWSLSPTHIWQLVFVKDVTDVTDRHFQKPSRPPFYATF